MQEPGDALAPETVFTFLAVNDVDFPHLGDEHTFSQNLLSRHEFAMRTKKSKSAPVGVIAKVLRVLECLDQFPAGLQLREVAAKTRINKSTVHRFLTHLEAEAYLFRDQEGTYMLGPKLVRLGNGVNAHATLSKIARPVLEKLRKVSDETVNLAVLDGFSILYLDVLESRHTFRLVSEVGMRRELHCTSLGRAIFANLDDERRKEEIFASIRTVTSRAKLEKELRLTRERGYSLDDEEAVAGARCIGAAIFAADGTVAGAISVSGPVSRVSKERLPFFQAEIGKAAREISSRLGYRAKKTALEARVKRPTRL
jgi:DNA-binding IclR family transcriptional regulator